MANRQTLRYIVLLLLLVTLLVAGCTRVFRSQSDAGDPAPENTTATVDESTSDDPAELPETPAEAVEEVAGGSDNEPAASSEDSATESGDAATSDSGAGETPRDAESPSEAASEEGEETSDDGATDESSATSESEAEESSTDAESSGDESEATAETEDTEKSESPSDEDSEETKDEGDSTAAAEDEGATDESTADDSAAPASDTSTVPHVVQPGENLYRIGLQYGISWVTLAQVNGLGDADVISAGQVIQIPVSAAPEPEPTPSPTTEVVYIVQPGDSLFSIGLAYGLTWDQIAEANGILNPNAIYAGQELKIPSGAPGPAPQFMHTVEPGDTLLRLSVRYGVTWQAIAEANSLTSPYVLYPGQTLVIPGQ